MKNQTDISADEYLVPAGETSAEIKVKGSKFIASIFPVSSKEAAEDFYGQVKKKYYDASHNCFAWRISEDEFRYSDDGEPSGTAGKPILQTLDGAGLTETLCVVTRYFGGTKLGTGGLIRAYSDSCAAALESLQIRTEVKTQRLLLVFNYDQEHTVRTFMGRINGCIVCSDYADKVQLCIDVPVSKCAVFEDQLNEASQSSIKITKV